MELVAQRRDVALVMSEHGLSGRQNCKLLELDRTFYRYERWPDRNAGLLQATIELARQTPRYGNRRLKRKRVQRIAPVAETLTAANQEWAIDAVMDSLIDAPGASGADDRGQLQARVPSH